MYVNKKKFIAIVSIVLAVILCVSALGIVSGGFRNWDYKHWFDKNDIVLDPNGGVVDDSGNDLESGKVYPMPSNMTFKSPSLNSASASDGVNFQVLAYPSDTSNSTVSWSISFVNATSTWATGKVVSDYVTYSVDIGYSRGVNVKCISAFGESIKLTATSNTSPNIHADCTIDYAKRITSANFVAGTGANTINLNNSNEIVVYDWNLHGSLLGINTFGGRINNVYNYGLGTKQSDISKIKCVIELNVPYDTGAGGTSANIVLSSNIFILNEVLFKNLFTSAKYDDPVLFNQNISKLKAFQATNGYSFSFALNCSDEYSSFRSTYKMKINEANLPVMLESLSFDNPNLVF